MSEVNKIGDKIIVECDCGAIHKLTKDDKGNIKIKSSVSKKEEEPKTKKEEEPKTKDDDWF